MLQKMALAKQVNVLAKKAIGKCSRCGHVNGTVKKVGALKIIHEPWRAKKLLGERLKFEKTFEDAKKSIKDLGPHLHKAQEDLNPLKVYNLLKQISDQDCQLLGLDPVYGRPEHYLWQSIPVPPVCIRPSVQQEGASNEDDLTVKLTEIIFTNLLIQQGLLKGLAAPILMEQWEFMQLSVAMYINSEMPGVPLQSGQRPIRGLCQRLKGKQGRFRGNLSGKRVDFSARTVISPDPNLDIDQVGVPELMAKNLTYPDRVTKVNLKILQKAILNGPDVHPGANYLTVSKTGFKRFLRFGDREVIASNLSLGDVVERHIRDDDIVLFNRQPSLHKLSIMAHRVKVRPWRTLRLNECVCGPYNADFDGDEMNMHVLQTEEARMEALELMGVKNNLVTPRSGEPVIAAIQDFITTSFLLTKKDRFFDRKSFIQACSSMVDANMRIDLPEPAIMKPCQLWTGKQLFNVLIRPNKNLKVFVNFQSKCRSFEKVPGQALDMCPSDGYLIIRNSEIMCGVMDKATLGEGRKDSLFYVLLRDFGPSFAAEAMTRLSKLCSRTIGTFGFSIGIDDVQPGSGLQRHKDNLVRTAYAECDKLISESRSGSLDNQPGCDQDQTLEVKISGVLSAVREDVGNRCMTELSTNNAPLIMATCGSKGSKINVSQMVACVGQQIISGSRVPNGFQDRSLPHFAKNSKEPPSKGFVRSSFYSGLSPTEFFFHAISGREGLVDTAVKTAETGYMQRRLMKALEDLCVGYDLSVRASNGSIVQFLYGDDCLDPTQLEGQGRPVNFSRTWTHVYAMSMGQDQEEGALLPYEIAEAAEEALSARPWVINCTREYIQSIKDWLQSNVVNALSKIREDADLIMGAEKDEMHDREEIVEYGDPYAKTAVNQRLMVTETLLINFLALCWKKYLRAKVEPGTTVGALGAQSIGEPGTQMTLKTFHFAGVASMNVTLGVPRIKEIINAAKSISTPIITCEIHNSTSESAARVVKARLETTHLEDIASVIEIVFKREKLYVGIHFDFEAIQRLQLDLTIDQIRQAILRSPKLKLKEHRVTVHKDSAGKQRIRIYPDSAAIRKPWVTFCQLTWIKRLVQKVIVKGSPSISRAVISEMQGQTVVGKKQLLVEGYGLRDVMTTDGVIGTKTVSNHVIEMKNVLGIEAARNTIIDQIQYTMKSHGMTIDPRHVMLLGDVMTYKGEVHGITRFGVAKMKDSVLMLASFEKTTDHLFDAALFSKKDHLKGVSECIIMGNPMAAGTYMPQLIMKNRMGEQMHVDAEAAEEKGVAGMGGVYGLKGSPRLRPLLFDRPELHRPLQVAV